MGNTDETNGNGNDLQIVEHRSNEIKIEVSGKFRVVERDVEQVKAEVDYQVTITDADIKRISKGVMESAIDVTMSKLGDVLKDINGGDETDTEESGE